MNNILWYYPIWKHHREAIKIIQSLYLWSFCEMQISKESHLTHFSKPSPKSYSLDLIVASIRFHFFFFRFGIEIFFSSDLLFSLNFKCIFFSYTRVSSMSILCNFCFDHWVINWIYCKVRINLDTGTVYYYVLFLFVSEEKQNRISNKKKLFQKVYNDFQKSHLMNV